MQAEPRRGAEPQPASRSPRPAWPRPGPQLALASLGRLGRRGRSAGRRAARRALRRGAMSVLLKIGAVLSTMAMVT